MKIAIISDIHENSHNLVLFFNEIEKIGVDKIFFLGDFMNNGIAKLLSTYKTPTFAIWGNNDGDKIAITKTATTEGSNLEVGFTNFDTIEVDGRKIFLTHYPMLAKPMAKSGDFDAVFYGHNHKKNIEKIGNCLVLNPGEISAHKTKIASFGIYDTKTNIGKLYDLTDSISIETDLSSNYRENNTNFKFGQTKSHQY